MNDITPLQQGAERGEADVAARLLPLVYDELRKLAAARMAHESPGLTLQPTALVHEAWLRLGGDAQPAWRSRAQFFAAAAEAMRRILIDLARKRQAQRHGGGQQRLDVAELELPANSDADLLLHINDALEKFAVREPQKAELVKLRYFGGLDHAEVAQTLGISEVTAKRWWSYARAWLFTELKNK